uniref:Uncharacterized protein n=1 Tax=Opuntia streptacantha TaxID=393608 RepID=A0A7C8YY80_OPUST
MDMIIFALSERGFGSSSVAFCGEECDKFAAAFFAASSTARNASSVDLASEASSCFLSLNSLIVESSSSFETNSKVFGGGGNQSSSSSQSTISTVLPPLFLSSLVLPVSELKVLLRLGAN